ncbi:MAG: amino acid adenylation domain-containing protein [Myxococcota bacterium]
MRKQNEPGVSSKEDGIRGQNLGNRQLPAVEGAVAGRGPCRDSAQASSLKLRKIPIGSSFWGEKSPRFGGLPNEPSTRAADAFSRPQVRIGLNDLTEDLAHAKTRSEPVNRDCSGDWAPDLVDRLRAQSARRADEIAVRAPEGELRYSELERLSNQLAHQLSGLGVAPGTRVGISLNRGARELLAMLATSKAGGVYIPLDPAQPPDRLRSLMQDASPEVLIVESDSPLASGGSEETGVQLMRFDRLDQISADASAAPLALSYSPEDLAYLMFTSGSTGRPKGVEVKRGGFANLLESLCTEPGVTEQDRLLAIATTAFDISGYELFAPLWVGGTVVIADRATAQDPIRLKRCLVEERITLMQATPATWRLLLGAGWEPGASLRMTSGGEPLTMDLAQRLLGPGCELWNLYGPTETTICSSVDRVLSADEITIGHPIGHTQMYVFDEAMQPVPDGEEGELCIGGRGVARGYHARPELTADRFVQNPLGAPGEILYRTGDLVRKRRDGRFECLGRLDHQVKIRGVRIELGEIESVLGELPGVDGVVVVADASNQNDPRLVAYWVGRASRQSLIDEARRMLPANIVPSAYIRLDAFPLTANAKVDRKQLPPLEAKHLMRALERLRDFSALEERVAAIWCDVLDLDSVELGEDFFTIGGTSARAAEVVALLHTETGLEMPLQAFFVAPTIEGIAENLEAEFSPDAPAIVQLREGDDERPPLWCLFGITIYRHLAASLHENRSVYGVHVPFRYAPGSDRQPSTAEVAAGYVKAIRSHQPHGPYQLMGLCFGGIVAFEAAAQLEAAGEEIELVTVVDAMLPTAVRVDSVGRLRGYFERAGKDPIAAVRRIGASGAGLMKRFVGNARDLPKLPTTEGDEPALIDLPMDGPEVQAEVAGFATRSNWLSCNLLVARAEEEYRVTWVDVDPDLGWRDFARNVIVRDIDSDHLHTLRPPHVGELVDAMTEAVSAAKEETEV